MKLRSRIVLLMVLWGAAFWLFVQFYVIKSVYVATEDRISTILKRSVETYIKNQPTRERLAMNMLAKVYLNQKILKGYTADPQELLAELGQNEQQQQQQNQAQQQKPAEQKQVDPMLIRHNYLFYYLQLIKDKEIAKTAKGRDVKALLLLDNKGKELARTEDAIWYKQYDWSNHAIVKKCLSGVPQEDFWQDKRLPTIGIHLIDCHPIIASGAVVGVAVMVRSFSDAYLDKVRRMAITDPKVHIAFVGKTGLIASSLPPGKHKALSDKVNSLRGDVDSIISAVKGKKRNGLTKEVKLVLDDEDFVGLLAPLALPEAKTLATMLVLYSWSEATGLLRTLSIANLLFVLLLTVIGIAVALLIVQYAYTAMDFVLEGAHKIILGNKEYQFASEDPYLDSLGQTLNVMLGVVSGKLIPEDEEEAMRMSIGSGGPIRSGGMVLIENIDESAKQRAAAEADKLYAEDKQEYYNRLFREFVRAKVECGEDVSTVSKERFIQKLEKTERRLIEKHGCKAVRFEVKIKNKKVTLVPVPLWK